MVRGNLRASADRLGRSYWEMSAEQLGGSLRGTAHAIEQMLSKAHLRKQRIESFTNVAPPRRALSSAWTDAERGDLEDLMVRGNLRATVDRLGRSYWASGSSPTRT